MKTLLISVLALSVAVYLFFKNVKFKENKITKDIDQLINIFGLNKYIPKINGVFVFYAFFLIVLVMLIKFILSGFIAGIIILAVALYTLNYVLKSIIINRTRKISKIYLNFLNIYTSFYNTFNNCPDALRETSKYIGQPLKNIIMNNMFLYDNTSKTFNEVLDLIANSVDDSEFRKFINFTKMYEKYGGNYNEVLDKLREQAIKNSEIAAERESNVFIATLVIGSMILLNLMSFVGLQQNDIYILTHTISGWEVLALNIISYIVGIYVIKNIAES